MMDYSELRENEMRSLARIADALDDIATAIGVAHRIRRVENAKLVEREACAKICEELPLTLMHPESWEKWQHPMSVAEAGCRMAFAAAIRERGNVRGKLPEREV